MILVPALYSRNSLPSHEPVEVDSTDARIVTIDSPRTVNSYFFFAFGGGLPQGFRFEFGQNIDSTIIVGATFSFNDQWSNDPSGGRVGIILGSRFAPSDSAVSPFVLTSVGETVAVYGNSEYYAFIHFGLKAPSKSIMHLRAEAGPDVTFRNSGTTSRKNQIWLGFNISLEIDLQ
jgi:hypothetical protein